jgi:hypothetical protein
MIRCKAFSNSACLKCGKVNSTMIRVGVFTMCIDCFVAEFGVVSEISPNSVLCHEYYIWLKRYQQKIEA